MKNGIIKYGFITIGNPNIIGSFILKHAAPTDILPTSLSCLLLEANASKKAKANVPPPPPRLMNKSKNGPPNTFGISFPAS